MQSRLAFIVGAESSGKQWLWRCLSTHAEALGLPETHAFLFGTRPEPSAASQVRDIDFWRIVRQMNEGTSHVDDCPIEVSSGAHGEALHSGAEAFLCAVDEERMRRLDALMHRLPTFATWDEVFGEVAETLDGLRPTLVEKSPGHVYYMQRIHSRFPAARFIGIVRDGRSVYAASIKKRKLWNLEPLDLKAAAMRWLRSTSTLLRFEAQFPSQVLVIRHEDLMQQRAEKVAEVCRFLEIDSSLPLIEKLVDFNTFQSAADPCRPGEPQGIDLDDTIRFENVIQEPEIAAFESLTAPMLERLSYPVHRLQQR